MCNVSPEPGMSRRQLLLLALFAGACVAVGVLVRFRGLGTWPLAVDEYYLAQSVQNILRVGLPEYPCGGRYRPHRRMAAGPQTPPSPTS